MTFRMLCNASLLLIVAAAALIHLNRMHQRSWVECLGFSAITAGAGGSALAYVWPGSMSSIYPFEVMNIGLALIAIRISASDLQRLINYDKAMQNFPRVVAVAETKEEGMKRPIFYESAVIHDAFVDKRFNRQA